MTSRSQFVQQFVIGLGFLNGVVMKLGTNPKDEIFKSFSDLIAVFSQQYAEWFTTGIQLLSVTLLVIAVITAYFKGGVWGVLAVLLAVTGGFILGPMGAALLVIAIIIGFFSCRTK